MHGTRQVKRRGVITHIDLCACHHGEIKPMVQVADMELRSVIEVLQRRMAAAELRASGTQKVAEEASVRIGYEATNIRAEIKTLLILVQKNHDETLDRFKSLELRASMQESVTLWVLVKRCFGR